MTKLKVQLKMAGSRIQIASNKKTALLKQNMREVAVLLAEEPPKEELASIKAEALIRDDNVLEALEIIQLECELLHERIKLLEFSQKCPEDLIPVVSTIIWASHRVDIPELLLVRKQFRAKYGKKFEEDALMNKNNCLNERVVAKLAIQPPAAFLVQTYLERICEQFEVSWEPKVKLSASQLVEPMVAPSGHSVQAGRGTGLVRATETDIPQPTTQSGPSGDIPEPLKIYDPSKVPHTPVVAAEVVPQPAPSAKNSIGETKSNDFDEVDIYVPPAAPSSNYPNDEEGTITSSKTADGGIAGTSGSTTSYEDLAARFDKLKTI